MKIGFIGYGNMASSIAKALIKYADFKEDLIYASRANYNKFLNDESKINKCQTNEEVVINSDFIILAVKPYQVEEVLIPLKDLLKEKILVSIVAGFTFDKYDSLIESKHISTIPNIPIEVGEGILITENKHNLTEEDLVIFESVFKSISLIQYVDTENFSVAGTIAGCTPAFTAMYMEALSEAALKFGIKKEDSYKIISQMLVGTAKLYQETKIHPAILKEKVCSPKGTTIKGVIALEKNNFRATVISAVEASEE